MMVEMSDGSVQGEPEARRECTLSTKPTPGGQRDRAGRANLARRGGRRHPRHPWHVLEEKMACGQNTGLSGTGMKRKGITELG